MKYIEETLFKEISEISDKLCQDRLIFRCNFLQLSKHFLSNFLDVNVWKSDFTTIKDDFLKNIKFEELKEKSLIEVDKKFIDFSKKRVGEIENACQNELDFHKYICKQYLDLTKEPKDELLSIYERIKCDITEIDKTLDDIQKQIDEITQNNKTEEIQEKKPILLYYQEHNKKAKDAILEFFKNDVENYALYNCYDNSLMRNIATNKLYNYYWNSNAYKPHYPNDLENKFGNLILPDFRVLCDKYKNNKNDFKKYLNSYISDNAIVYCVKNLIDKHHLLYERNELLIEALNVYENGAKIIFANAVPTIIEGILHDLCVLNGENENELLSKGFQYKLDKLKDILSYELYYEYYAFKFRLFRNKVAHGRLNKSDDELPDLLLLDLYQICKLVFSTKIKFNQKRFLIEEINTDLSNIEYKFILEYTLLDEIIIPNSYNLGEQILSVENIISSDSFWKYLESEVDNNGEICKHGILSIIQKLKKKRKDNKTLGNKCIDLIKKIGIKKINQDYAKEYIKDLSRYY